MLKSCWVVRAELAESLVNADVTPRKSDEGAAFDKLAGMTEDEIRAEEASINQTPVVRNEEYEVGLKLVLRMADTGNEFERFLSLSDIDEMAFHRRFDPPKTTPELAEWFGQKLVQRTEPMTIAILDRDANLEEVVRTPGRPDGVLDGNEPGVSFLPKDE
jgi:hypothetical protein